MNIGEICRKVTDLGEAGQRTLIYYITSERVKFPEIDGEVVDYGVKVSISESEEESTISGITTVREKIEELIDMLATGYVTPVILGDIVYDWLAEQ